MAVLRFGKPCIKDDSLVTSAATAALYLGSPMSGFSTARQKMVDGQVRPSDVTDIRIIDAMLAVPREAFVPQNKRALIFRYKCLAGHREHRIDNPDIGNVAGTYLTIDHLLARGRKTRHLKAPSRKQILPQGEKELRHL